MSTSLAQSPESPKTILHRFFLIEINKSKFILSQICPTFQKIIEKCINSYQINALSGDISFMTGLIKLVGENLVLMKHDLFSLSFLLLKTQ